MLLSQFFCLSSQQKDQNYGYLPVVGQKGKDVMWVPTPHEMIEAMFSLARLTSSDTLIDLGSGDGRIVIDASKKGAYAIGVEFNPELVELSKRNAERDGLGSRTLFVREDLFKYDLSHASVISIFLLEKMNLRLRPTLLNLRPGTRIVSNTFSLGNWEPDRDTTIDNNINGWNNAYLWVVPARVEGVWKMGDNLLTIRQQYQAVYGALVADDIYLPITSGRLNGSIITFRLGNKAYSGQVIRDKIKGTAKTDSGTFTWEAERTDLVQP